jgi:hypothetical protein
VRIHLLRKMTISPVAHEGVTPKFGMCDTIPQATIRCCRTKRPPLIRSMVSWIFKNGLSIQILYPSKILKNGLAISITHPITVLLSFKKETYVYIRLNDRKKILFAHQKWLSYLIGQFYQYWVLIGQFFRPMGERTNRRAISVFYSHPSRIENKIILLPGKEFKKCLQIELHVD